MGRVFQWIGTIGSKWVFEGQHTFDVHSLANGRSRVVNHEQVSGLLTPVVLSEEPERDYERMNHALKEGSSGGPESFASRRSRCF